MCARFFIPSVSVATVVGDYGVHALLSNFTFHSVFTRIWSRAHIRQTAIVTIVRHRCHSFLPHFAVPFQKMLPPFSNVDLFLNITSTPCNKHQLCAMPFLRPASFYLSRHFNHLYACHANTASESETGKGQNKNVENDSLK